MSDTIQQFDFSVDLLKALLWEYNQAGTLQSLLNAKQIWYNTNQRDFWQNWLTNVFDLRTANEFGCIVWALILGIPVDLITNPNPSARHPFGFDVTTKTNFNNYNFSSSGTSRVSFTTAEKRLILRLRYRKLVSRGVIPETNQILKDLIIPTYGECYMLDGLNMTQRLITRFAIPSALGAILTEFDILPRPGGVRMIVVDRSIPVFGFGPANVNFEHGGFNPYDLEG